MATHRDVAASLDPHSVVYEPSQLRQQVGLSTRLLIPVRQVPVAADLDLAIAIRQPVSRFQLANVRESRPRPQSAAREQIISQRFVVGTPQARVGFH